jgi:cell division protein FtsI/penicillin-binding protein 2
MRIGMNIRPSQYRRLWMFALLMVLAFGGLGYRLVVIQVFQHEQLLADAEQAWHRTQVQPTQRGKIYDVRGQLLATSVRVKTVSVDPTRVGEQREEIARALAPILGIPSEKLAKRMEPRQFISKQGQKVDVLDVVLKRNVTLEDWERIQGVIGALKLKKNTIFAQPADGESRLYPNGSLAAHVLGFTGPGVRQSGDLMSERLVGKSGIEASMDEVLNGTWGMRRVMQGERQDELVAKRLLDIAPRSGLGVVLTIDAGIQHIVESEIEAAYLEHEPISVTCVAVRPRTGEILAMANVPTFNPNRLDPGASANWRNRAITDLAEPGSTFKALVVAGAFNEGLVNLDTEVNCERGAFRFHGRTLHDVSRYGYGMLRVEEVIAKSSNIGAAKIGIMLGKQRLYHYMRAFGMGEPTRLPLGGEVRGLVNPVKDWSKISVAWIPMGHEVATTPLQMVMAMSAIANEGRLMHPMLVKALVDEQGRMLTELEPTMVRQVVGEQAARQMTQALKTAVASGTGKRAKMEFYEVAGKTGTAQKIINGKHSSEKHFVSFIGFFPADEPELCISVVIDEPKSRRYGGETAAPVWKRIAERASSYLGIPATRGVDAPMLTGPARAGVGQGGF